MTRLFFPLLRVYIPLAAIGCCAQLSPAKASVPPVDPNSKLAVVTRVKVSSEMASMIVGYPQCDSDGNIYMLTDYDANVAIRKLNPKGELVALFRASSVPDLAIDFAWNFSVSPDGGVSQIIYLRDSADRYVVFYNKDGSYKSKIKLDTGFDFIANFAAPFPSGGLIVAGLKYDRNPRQGGVKRPFTGIFSWNGALLKTSSLEDDKGINDLVATGDKRVVDTPHGTNAAVERGVLEIGADGNAYLMRRLSPAIIYAISPGGAVVRRFTVDPGPDKRSYMPNTMHVAGGRIAVLFQDWQTKDQVIKVTDLEGRDVASYDDERMPDGKLTLGPSLACLVDAPERYIFLGATDDDKLEFRIAEPR